MIRYHYTKQEMEQILTSMVILVDTREKKNEHILSYFRKKEIPFKLKTLDTGDYSAMIPKNEALGITRAIYLDSCIERKANIDELVGNLSASKRTAFENELIRSQKAPFLVLVEDQDGYGNILKHNYRSSYDPKALLGTLLSLEIRYGFQFHFRDPIYSGNYIYHRLYYQLREYLKTGVI